MMDSGDVEAEVSVKTANLLGETVTMVDKGSKIVNTCEFRIADSIPHVLYWPVVFRSISSQALRFPGLD